VDNPKVDLGTLNKGDERRHVFKITNVGTVPYVVDFAGVTCDCVQWNETYPKSLEPGATFELSVGYKAKYDGPFDSGIDFLGNTEPIITQVRFTGTVKP
jgi:hypothetical protein